MPFYVKDIIDIVLGTTIVSMVIFVNFAVFLKGCMILTGRFRLPRRYTLERVKEETKFIGVTTLVLTLLGVVAVSNLGMGIYAAIVVLVAWILLVTAGARLEIVRPTPGKKKGLIFYSKERLKRELKLKVPVELKKTFTPGVIAFSLGLIPGLVMGWHPLTTVVVGFLFYCVASFIALIGFLFWSAGKMGETLAKGAKIIEAKHKKMKRETQEYERAG